MTFKTRLSVLLISTPILAFVLIGGILGNAATRSDDESFQHLRVFQEVLGLVMQTYVEEVEVGTVMEGAMRGLADGLDPDSAYLSVEQMREMKAGAPLPAGEIGIELTRQYYLRVIAAQDGSPAAKAGLQTGDYIRAIDGRSTRGLSVFEGDRLLRGAPGSTVTLTVIRSNAADPHELTLTRAKLTPAAVSAKMLDHGAGYIRIPAFTSATAGDVKRHAANLAGGGAKALVIDLRRTATGGVEHAVAAARLFVGSGTITATAGRPAEGQKALAKTPVVAGTGDGAIGLPVQLLVSAGTSGAAEVFAAALDGNARADIIGEHTIGRAAEQKLVPLPEGRGLWLTHKRYYTPAGERIHGTGLKPDVGVAEPDVEFGASPSGSDPLLDAALERVRTGNMLKAAEPEKPQ